MSAAPGIGELAGICEEIAEAAGTLRWPNPKYLDNIEGFARDILGVDTVWDGQRRIFSSVEAPESSTVVRAGTKVGKTFSIGVVILWFFCSVPECQVALTASTEDQVKDTIWREIALLRGRSGRCVECRKADAPTPCPHSARIDGHMSPDPKEGMRSDDGRVVRSVVSNKEDAYAGISGGSKLLLVADECTGISDTNMAYFRGNRHGARCLYYANPTRTEGWFYEAHGTKQAGQHTLLHLSTYEAADTGIDGLATHKTIREAEIEYGEDSAIFLSKYRGEFPTRESMKLISMFVIAEAVSRWGSVEVPEDAPLIAGLDPAGLGDDRSVIVVRRGDKVIDIRDRGQLDAAAVALFAVETLRDHVRPGEKPELRYDATGQIGADVGRELRAYLAEVTLVALIANAESTKKTQFKSLRDQLWWVCRMWLREGGAIPDHARLQAELHAAEHSTDAANRTVIESKVTLKKRLGGRSPDFADALCLATWNDPGYVHKPMVPFSPEPRRDQGVSPYELARKQADGMRGAIYGKRR